MKRTLLLCLVSCVAVAVSGCACNSWLITPVGPGAACDSSGGCGGCGACGATACGPAACGTTACGGACGSTACGPAACVSTCEPVRDDCGTACGGACGGACSEPCETACGQCAGASSAACGLPCGPLTWLFAILSHGYCGESCGEVWWGDWDSAPPDCCDPCNRCGEYTGRGSPTCETCGTGGYAAEVRQIDTTHVSAGPTNGNVAVRHLGTKPTGGHITDASSKYAPKLISITDRAVDASQPGSVPQALLPRRMPAHR